MRLKGVRALALQSLSFNSALGGGAGVALPGNGGRGAGVTPPPHFLGGGGSSPFHLRHLGYPPKFYRVQDAISANNSRFGYHFKIMLNEIIKIRVLGPK